MKLLNGFVRRKRMTGDKEIDNTLWYDMIINQTFKTNEDSELAAPLQKGEKAPSQTSSSTSS
jgi:hypothetical protein